MKTTLRSFIFILLTVAGGMGLQAGSAFASAVASPQEAKAINKAIPKFVQVVIDFRNIPTFLDSNGHVWSTHRLMEAHSMGLYQLPNLEHIVKIKPFMALDDKGRVFTWKEDDNQTIYEEGYYVNSGFTVPTIVDALENVTDIDNSNSEYFDAIYFTAIVSSKDVFVWTNEKSISMVYSKAGIKAVSSRAAPEMPFLVNGKVIPEFKNLILLFNSGDVISLEIKQSGKQAEGSDLRETLLGHYSGATDVVRNNGHVVVLSSDGTPKFWGGCFVHGQDIIEKLRTPNAVNGASGYITKVAALVINDDNNYPDVFIKKDGSIWASYAPIPEGKAGLDCYKSSDQKLFWEIKVANAKIVQAVAHNNQILMLDSNGGVWATDGFFDFAIFKVKTKY